MGSSPEGMTISVKPTDAATLREQDLLRRVQAGQKEYFYDLIKPYQRRVYSAALSILRNEAEAEDAAQEAFLKALTHIQQFRAEARFSTWLIQIAVNEALMRKRKAHTEVMEPIGEREEEDGSYTPRDSPTGARFPRNLWSARKSAPGWRKLLPPWPRSIARFSSYATCST